jgi:hypothetical protein
MWVIPIVLVKHVIDNGFCDRILCTQQKSPIAFCPNF